MHVQEITREELAAVANEIVRLKAQYYGKGPTEAKAYQNDEVDPRPPCGETVKECEKEGEGS